MNRMLVYFCFLGLLYLQGQGQTRPSDNIDYYNPDVFQYKDWIYDDHIKTVYFRVNKTTLSHPIIALNSTAQLELHFDELAEVAGDYRFSIIHCNADWTPSDLHPMDYMDGFSEDYIQNYRYSFNTQQSYVHYWVFFPTNNIKITKSGNYLLKIYDIDDNILLTRRFMVYEQLIGIQGRIYNPNLMQYRKTHQRLEVFIDYEGLNISNPLADLTISILQNGRWDNALINVKPTFIGNNRLEYSQFGQLVFEGGNEFRFFDMRNLPYKRQGVQKVVKTDSLYQVVLKPDSPRTRRQKYVHINYQDLNGRFQIDRWRNSIRGLDADYTYTHFFLPMDSVIEDGNLYIFGGLTDWNILPQFQMHYNPIHRTYEKSLFLKQGYYNYQYVLVRDGDPKKDAALVEGSYYNTENDYFILVYHHDFNARYDRLVGVEMLNSIR